jgi:hypothetical protein
MRTETFATPLVQLLLVGVGFGAGRRAEGIGDRERRGGGAVDGRVAWVVRGAVNALHQCKDLRCVNEEFWV